MQVTTSDGAEVCALPGTTELIHDVASILDVIRSRQSSGLCVRNRSRGEAVVGPYSDVAG